MSPLKLLITLVKSLINNPRLYQLRLQPIEISPKMLNKLFFSKKNNKINEYNL